MTGGYIAAGYPQALDVIISYNILVGISAPWGAIHLHGGATGPSYHECDRGYVGYNTISGVTGPGIWTVGNDDVTIEHNHIAVSGTGIDILNHVGTGIEIIDNTITNPGQKGINYWAGPGGIIRGNTITGTGWEGIFSDTKVTIQGNTVSDCLIGIQIYPPASEVVVQYNNIYQNSYGLINHAESQVDATLNWWGHSSGPGGPDGRINKAENIIGKGDTIFGPVDWDPWLPQPVLHTPHDPVPPGLYE